MKFSEVAAALEVQRYIYAKTMPYCPHWYCLRKNWVGNTDFEAVVQFIRDYGYEEKFYSKTMVRLDVNGMKYWSMGAPLGETILINRAHIERPVHYDTIADEYDGLHSDPASKEEEQTLFSFLEISGSDSVLDIGCGTGIILDYVSPASYVGIDPSAAMLKRANDRARANGVRRAFFYNTTLESFYTGSTYDVVCSTFGSADYCSFNSLAELPRLLREDGRVHVMLFDERYFPKTHKELGITPRFFRHDPNALLNVWRAFGLKCGLSRLNDNFLVLSGRRFL